MPNTIRPESALFGVIQKITKASTRDKHVTEALAEVGHKVDTDTNAEACSGEAQSEADELHKTAVEGSRRAGVLATKKKESYINSLERLAGQKETKAGSTERKRAMDSAWAEASKKRRKQLF